ncbi:MAG: HAD-IA family hydrolase, partial [Pseudomonadales bacterium]
TVLLDMDGTLLDLHYDNHFWQQHLPDHYARLHALLPDDARRLLTEKFLARQGDLAFYCIDHWSRELELDILPLKSETEHRIRYLPGALALLEFLGERRIEKVLVTNAHRKTLALKDAAIGICSQVDAHYASHDFGLPKEDPAFWALLAETHAFNPAKTVLIDDNMAVLLSASQYALRTCVLPLQPDSCLPPRESVTQLAAGSAELLPVQSLFELVP